MDIGDKVKKGDVLATLFVPELVEDFGTKKATVKLDEERIDLARKLVEVADADVKAAEAEPRRGQGRSWPSTQAEVERWDIRGQAAHRGGRPGRGRPPDPPGVDEPVEVEHRRRGTRPRRRSPKAEADLLSSEAKLAKAKVDVAVAQADLAVAESEAKRLEAWVGYLTLLAPFDGIDRGPQRQHRRLRPARHRRPHGR